ncbi:tail fiber protein [Yersinia enterocolitica]
MNNIMPPINTPDNAFHDGNPATGEQGTIVPGLWLNNSQGATRNIQQEIISVLAEAEIEIDETKDNQLLTAILSLITASIPDLPVASLTQAGIVKLISSLTSDSESLAATAKAVKLVANAIVTSMSDHIQTANPHHQYLAIANFLSEIKDVGPAAVAQTLLNLGLGDISTRLPKFIILYPDGTESAPAIMTKNIRKAIANPFPGRRVEALVEVLIAGQWGVTGWLYNPNVAGFGSGISAYPYGSNSSDDFIIIQSGGLEVTTSSSSAGNPHGISAQVTSAPYRIRIKTVN